MKAFLLLAIAATGYAMDLKHFEQLALKDNPSLRQAELAVRRSEGLAKQAGLLPNPSIGYQGEQIRGGAYRGGEQGAFVQQTFVLGGKLGLRRNVYEQERQGAQIGVEEQRQRVLGDVDGQFYTALAAQELVKLREQLVRIASEAVTTAHESVNVGQADAPDVLQAEVESEQAKLDLANAQRAFRREFAVLAAVAGQSDLQPVALEGDLAADPKVDVDHLLNEALRSSPTVKRVEQDVTRAEAQLKSAKREAIPDVTVRAGVQNNSEPVGAFGNTPVGAQAFVTAGITLPLFNRNQGNAMAAEADVERARSEISRVRLSIRQQAQPMMEGYLSAQQTADRYRNEMIPKAKKAYELNLAKYQQMAAPYPQVIVSQRTWFQLQAAYVGVLKELWTSAIALQHFLLSDGLSAPPASGESLSIDVQQKGVE
jgi:outer membrane protein, heavy metal efflux system